MRNKASFQLNININAIKTAKTRFPISVFHIWCRLIVVSILFEELYLAMIATRRELTSFNCYAYYDMIDALNCQLNFGLKSYYAPFNASFPFSLRHLDGYDYQLNI